MGFVEKRSALIRVNPRPEGGNRIESCVPLLWGRFANRRHDVRFPNWNSVLGQISHMGGQEEMALDLDDAAREIQFFPDLEPVLGRHGPAHAALAPLPAASGGCVPEDDSWLTWRRRVQYHRRIKNERIGRPNALGSLRGPSSERRRISRESAGKASIQTCHRANLRLC
jgi:hypothetical protein